MTFKSEIFEICQQVAVEFHGWKFTSSGDFVNKALKHTDLIVSPGFVFNAEPSCSVSPVAGIKNRKIVRLYKDLFGREPFWTLSVKFQLESEKYRGAISVKRIYPQKVPFTTAHEEPNCWPDGFIVRAEALTYLRGVLTDGRRYVEKYFDLSSEESLLRNLPVSYQWMDKGIGNSGQMGSFYEESDGIVHCLAAIILGDFDFVERYRSDEFKTMTPKRVHEIDKIVSVLPELKRRFSETGSVV
ncbi:hypothetical protein DSC91_002908 [Paraburkholderia caffeinilytica]|uniref:Uncharacterized protein n=1 Tax=Paraburkholderia caffeinilytica TaxID=1761016 RepID=A0ABQ1MR40_9BURK|nr:hypothetical protein [Paraburkholderia caffeinilytica]AXL50614.1 hypothetical protein DSC91_002908 [Paraburkholderia caffeinilytica]GGC45004.1 hypothetical protein GCM10011400_35160 [Paraburkholderia caffeinilytica]CAB3801773.1 hypothetical protein LMG28690_05455 [Paraburkholderia caffeinilytica]